MRVIRTKLLMLLALVVLGASAFAYDQSTPVNHRNVLLISWDGVRREDLDDCLQKGRLPNLAALIADGKIIQIKITDHETDTKSGHAEMLTGEGPDVTGVYSDKRFQPIPKGMSIFARLESALGNRKITTIMLTAKANNLGAHAPVKRWLFRSARPGEPWYLASKEIDYWDGGIDRYSGRVGTRMVKLLADHDRGRFFMFVHFRDPDSAGHRYGENSGHYDDAIIACDKWLGEAIAELKRDRAYDRTMILVTTDHGFARQAKMHKHQNTAFLASDVKAISRAGTQLDITPTLLDLMGIDPATSTPKLPGRSLASR